MGIVKDIIVHGEGSPVTPGRIVTVHCTGFVKKNGLYEEFWSTLDCQRLRSPAPFSFKVGEGHVIKVWDQGVLGMKLGEVAILKCKDDDAFGAKGYPTWNIAPNSNLEFVIEVVAIDWLWGKKAIDARMKGATSKLPR